MSIACQKQFTLQINNPLIGTKTFVTAGTNEMLDNQTEVITCFVERADNFAVLAVGTFGVYIDSVRTATVANTGNPTHCTIGPLPAGVHLLNIHFDGTAVYAPSDAIFAGVPLTTPNIVVQPLLIYSSDMATMWNANSSTPVTETLTNQYPVVDGFGRNTRVWRIDVPDFAADNIIVETDGTIFQLTLRNIADWGTTLIYTKTPTPPSGAYPACIGTYNYTGFSGGSGPAFIPASSLHVTTTP